MDIPQRFPYNPQWRLSFCLLVFGALLLFLAYIVRVPFGFPAVMGTLFFTGGLALFLRRIAFQRFIELGQDAVLLPTGFLQRRTTKILYADIEWIHESAIETRPRLSIGTNGRTFEFNPFLLDTGGFIAVRDFLNSLPGPKEKEASRQNKPIEPGIYCFRCTYDGDGEIFNSRGESLWRVKTQDDFIVYDKTDRELIKIKRERSLLAPQYVMLAEGVPVGRISQRSILLNRYRLDFEGHSKWKFHMPLFTVYFRGISDTGARIQVCLWTHNIWYLKIDADADSPQLVAALAFIHRQRLRY